MLKSGARGYKFFSACVVQRAQKEHCFKVSLSSCYLVLCSGAGFAKQIGHTQTNIGTSEPTDLRLVFEFGHNLTDVLLLVLALND